MKIKTRKQSPRSIQYWMRIKTRVSKERKFIHNHELDVRLYDSNRGTYLGEYAGYQ
jgi:hypothetical protein